MSRPASILLIVAMSASLAACGDDAEPTAPGALHAPSPTAVPRSTVAAEPTLGQPATVPANANIFGAGLASPPAPGKGGAGVLPPRWRLSKGSDRVVTFPRIAGRVTPIEGDSGENGPAGDHIGPTDVNSHGAISGIVDDTNGMFLVGVFLTGDHPSRRKAPHRLDFTKRERFRSLSPQIGQTFFIGDGARHTYRVPAGATDLYLGFADGFHYQGLPGWYGNNVGALTVTVTLDGGT